MSKKIFCRKYFQTFSDFLTVKLEDNATFFLPARRNADGIFRFYMGINRLGSKNPITGQGLFSKYMLKHILGNSRADLSNC
jgi:hypothetical protein